MSVSAILVIFSWLSPSAVYGCSPFLLVLAPFLLVVLWRFIEVGEGGLFFPVSGFGGVDCVLVAMVIAIVSSVSRENRSVTTVGCDQRQRTVGRCLTSAGRRPATSAICLRIGRSFPGVDLNAICQGLGLLASVNRTVGVPAPSNKSQFSKGIVPRGRFLYADYKQLLSLRLSVGDVRRIGQLTKRGFSKVVASDSALFCKRYDSYVGGSWIVGGSVEGEELSL